MNFSRFCHVKLDASVVEMFFKEPIIISNDSPWNQKELSSWILWRSTEKIIKYPLCLLQVRKKNWILVLLLQECSQNLGALPLYTT